MCEPDEHGHDHVHMPLIGDRFPAMEVHTTHGPLLLPEAFEGRWFLLFSHPADFTPVCTSEFVALQRRAADFAALQCDLIGLSIDQVFSHISWLEWIHTRLKEEITFPVISDDAGRGASVLGLLHPAKATNTVRGVFIVDPSGTIRAMLFYPQELGRNVEELLRMLRGLQMADREDVALPANWPHNELIGDGMIVPPATDTATARSRPDEFECFDWWFCHRPLPRR